MSFFTRPISIKLGTLITWVRGSLLEIYMTLDLVVTWCHITDKIRSISSSTRPITNKLGIMVTNQINSDDPFFKWLLEVNLKMLHLFFNTTFDHQVFKDQGLSWGAQIILPLGFKIMWKMKSYDKDPDLFSTRFWKNKLGWEETHSKHDVQNYDKYAAGI